MFMTMIIVVLFIDDRNLEVGDDAEMNSAEV
jgi:hypothetical protein